MDINTVATLPSLPTWIAVDWGTSNLRVWAMDDSANILATQSSPLGMNAIAGDDALSFEGVLIGLIDDWLPKETDAAKAAPISVVICGMAGAKQGWLEAPYCDVPARPSDLAKGAAAPKTTDPRIAVSILPGLCQRDDADVMRGEETQLVGFMAAHRNFAGWVCLPGTHSKWARIDAGQITGFRTYMSGEVFALLSQNSILRHSVTDDTWDDAAFADAVRAAHAAPNGFLHTLFTVRAAGLVANGHAVPSGVSVLSGTVIGAEIADVIGMLKPNEAIALVGDGKLAGLYRAALAVHNIEAKAVDGEAITLAGLTQAHDVLSAQG